MDRINLNPDEVLAEEVVARCPVCRHPYSFYDYDCSGSVTYEAWQRPEYSGGSRTEWVPRDTMHITARVVPIARNSSGEIDHAARRADPRYWYPRTPSTGGA